MRFLLIIIATTIYQVSLAQFNDTKSNKKTLPVSKVNKVKQPVAKRVTTSSESRQKTVNQPLKKKEWRENYKEISNLISDDRRAVTDNNDNIGFVNSVGELVIPCKYKCSSFSLLQFYEGYCDINFDGKSSLINTNGEVVLQPKYNGIINTKYFIIAYTTNYHDIYPKSDFRKVQTFDYSKCQMGESKQYDCEILQVERNKKWGAWDKYGNLVIPIKYDNQFIYHEGLAAVKIGDKLGYIDSNGYEIIPFVYEAPYNLSDSFFKKGLASVKKGNLCGAINLKGEIVIPFKYDYLFQVPVK